MMHHWFNRPRSLLVGLALALACSRTEPQQAASVPQPEPASAPPEATPAPAPAAAEPSQPPPAPAAEPSGAAPVEAAGAKPPAAATPRAEVTFDGKPWDTSQMKVSAMDAWLGFVVDVESPQGERMSIHVKRVAAQGARFTAPDVDVVYTRGDGKTKEWWRTQGKKATASITTWRDTGPQPILSLDWTTTLRRDGKPSQRMEVEAHVRDVEVATHEATTKPGLERMGY